MEAELRVALLRARRQVEQQRREWKEAQVRNMEENPIPEH